MQAHLTSNFVHSHTRTSAHQNANALTFLTCVVTFLTFEACAGGIKRVIVAMEHYAEDADIQQSAVSFLHRQVSHLTATLDCRYLRLALS